MDEQKATNNKPLQPDEYEKEKFKRIGERLRTLRKERGYSGYDTFALQNNLQRTTYLKMEQGKGFQMATLIKVLRIYDMTFEEFFKDTGI